MRKFTTIKLENGVSSIRRLPRLGKIRLGVIEKKGEKEYPRETDYFVVPDEVKKVYGPAPKTLDVMFPVEAVEMIFPQFLGAYGANHRLLCHGDGIEAERYDQEKKEWVKRECPCDWLESRKCARRSNLMVILPKINLGGVYQIDSGSFNAIVNLNSYFDYIRHLVGRISWFPLKLLREPTQTLDPEGRNQTHYPLKLAFDGTVDAVNAIRQESDRIISQVQSYAVEQPLLEGPLPDTPYIEAGSGEGTAGAPTLPELGTTLKQFFEGMSTLKSILGDNLYYVEMARSAGVDKANKIKKRKDQEKAFNHLLTKAKEVIANGGNHTNSGSGGGGAGISGEGGSGVDPGSGAELPVIQEGQNRGDDLSY